MTRLLVEYHTDIRFHLPDVLLNIYWEFDGTLERWWSDLLNNIGSTELLVIAAIFLLIFGGKKLPELAKGIGDAIKEFRKAAKETT